VGIRKSPASYAVTAKSQNVLSDCYGVFLNLGGVRPFPGAAIQTWPNGRLIASAAGAKAVAAAGDGRAPYFENTSWQFDSARLGFANARGRRIFEGVKFL
jgi:hypothetical protein